MNAILLAAGFGTRLGDLGKKTSKAFLPVGKQPAIDRVLGSLAGSTIKNVHVVHNARWAFAFHRWKKSLVYQPSPGEPIVGCMPYVKLHSNEIFSEDEKLGAVGDLDAVLTELGEPRDFLLLLIDNVFTFSVVDFLKAIESMRMEVKPGTIWLTLRRVSADKAEDLGTVEFFNPEEGRPQLGQVLSFNEKKTSGDGVLAWLGPAFFPASAIPLIHEYCAERRREKKDVDRLGDLMAWLIEKETPVGGWVSTKGEAFEIGTAKGYEQALGYFGR